MKMTRAHEVLTLCKRLIEITDLGNKAPDLEELAQEDLDDFLENIIEASNSMTMILTNLHVSGNLRLKAKVEAEA